MGTQPLPPASTKLCKGGGGGSFVNGKMDQNGEQYFECLIRADHLFDFNIGEQYVRRCWGMSVNQKNVLSK